MKNISRCCDSNPLAKQHHLEFSLSHFNVTLMNDFIHCTRHLSFDCRHCIIKLRRAMMTKLSNVLLHCTLHNLNSASIILCLFEPKSSSCQGYIFFLLSNWPGFFPRIKFSENKFNWFRIEMPILQRDVVCLFFMSCHLIELFTPTCSITHNLGD